MSKGVLSGNGLCLEGVMYGLYGGGFVRGGFVRKGFCPCTNNHPMSKLLLSHENIVNLDLNLLCIMVIVAFISWYIQHDNSRLYLNAVVHVVR